MRKILSTQEFKVYMEKCKNKHDYQKLQAMNLYVIEKRTAKEVATIISRKPGDIYQWFHRYKNGGIDGLLSKNKGGRNRQLMTRKEEMDFLNEIKHDANKGLVVVAKIIKQKVEEKLNKIVSQSYVYNLLEKQNWRKIKPRPKNPKSSLEQQKKFKENFPALVQEVSETFDPNDKRPLLITFEDEARFGRMNRPQYCWAPKGVRPIVPCQLVRQYLYVFSIVSPKTGENFSLIMPDADTMVMNVFLEEVSQHYKDYRVIIVTDQASWHKSKGIKKFNNIRFIYLPPGSPELNPVEHLWDHVREKYFANQIFNSIADVKKRLVHVFKEVYNDTNAIQSIVGFPWAI